MSSPPLPRPPGLFAFTRRGTDPAPSQVENLRLVQNRLPLLFRKPPLAAGEDAPDASAAPPMPASLPQPFACSHGGVPAAGGCTRPASGAAREPARRGFVPTCHGERGSGRRSR
ncbi:hypothetical protein SEVIR_3G246550v4 [Setaria viridis]|uniref:Uncharacterized protein n=1 Tax=Setaria viridis TaxID=4556 RepID=A0A4U6VEW9_SETVI|nr:hypothetical protein SEVIR_3G246550v2 [Setaria viridis]